MAIRDRSGLDWISYAGHGLCFIDNVWVVLNEESAEFLHANGATGQVGFTWFGLRVEAVLQFIGCEKPIRINCWSFELNGVLSEVAMYLQAC